MPPPPSPYARWVPAVCSLAVSRHRLIAVAMLCSMIFCYLPVSTTDLPEERLCFVHYMDGQRLALSLVIYHQWCFPSLLKNESQCNHRTTMVTLRVTALIYLLRNMTRPRVWSEGKGDQTAKCKGIKRDTDAACILSGLKLSLCRMPSTSCYSCLRPPVIKRPPKL